MPAYNEAEAIGAVIAELRAFDPDLEIVVVDDGSMDGTARRAAEAGVEVVRLPFNLGIGGAMQTGYQYARDHGFDLAIQVDGDGQHDAREITELIEPILDGEADMTVGTRFAGGRRYRPPFARRIGIQLFARVVQRRIRAGRVAVGRREERGSDGERHLTGDLYESVDVLLVAVAP